MIQLITAGSGWRGSLCNAFPRSGSIDARRQLRSDPHAFLRAERKGTLGLCYQCFCNLHGVQRRAFEQLIPGNEQRDRAAARVAQILADAAD